MGALVIQNMKKKMHKSYILQFVLLICLACCARGDANVCQIQTDQIDSGCRFQEPLDMNNFQIPEGFNLDAVVEAVTKGAGWIKLEQMYSAADVERAKEVVYHHNQADKRNVTLNKHKHETRDEAHNKYNGLVWALFNKGRIFEKMPGQEGQLPHLDYPYYRSFYPSTNHNIMDTAPPLAVQFVTLLSDFTKENGGTGIRPHSHHLPRYPDDVEDFYANMIQMEGKAGDVVVFAGAIQHCAMPNRSKGLRTGMLQHMVPVYIKPFEAMSDYVREEIKARATPAMKRILALDHPYPVLKM